MHFLSSFSWAFFKGPGLVLVTMPHGIAVAIALLAVGGAVGYASAGRRSGKNWSPEDQAMLDKLQRKYLRDGQEDSLEALMSNIRRAGRAPE